MSKFSEGFNEKFNPLDLNASWENHLAMQFPELTSAIAGTPGWKPGTSGTPPMTLMIFAKDGKLRFSLSCRDWPRSFFCHVKDALHVLESVEEALVMGDGEWVTKRPDKR